MIEPITFLALCGAVIAAFTIVQISRTTDGLGKIISHFQNYAVIAILAAVTSRFMPPLTTAVEPSLSILIPGVAYFCAFALLGGLTLANYYFGLRDIGRFLGPTRFGAAKVFAVRAGYTLLLLGLRPIVLGGN